MQHFIPGRQMFARSLSFILQQFIVTLTKYKNQTQAGLIYRK